MAGKPFMLSQKWANQFIKLGEFSPCEPFIADKVLRKSFGEVQRAFAPLNLIHLDIYVPMNVRKQTNTL